MKNTFYLKILCDVRDVSTCKTYYSESILRASVVEQLLDRSSFGTIDFCMTETLDCTFQGLLPSTVQDESSEDSFLIDSTKHTLVILISSADYNLADFNTVIRLFSQCFLFFFKLFINLVSYSHAICELTVVSFFLLLCCYKTK